MRIAFIGRAAKYSPNSVGKDLAILAETRRQLQAMGFSCADIVLEDVPVDMVEADAYVSMGRKQDTLNWLGDFERRYVPVINCTAGVKLCNQRTLLMRILEEEVEVAPRIGGDGYWVKRGYGSAESADDVQYAKDRMEADRIAIEMMERGIIDVDVRSHVVGDVVKFYAVHGTDFFRWYYPGDDGEWKFNAEQHNGKPHHYAFDMETLRTMAARAAEIAHLDIYGGDCVIRPDGKPVLVDLNDWPSFSRCRDEAAVAIAQRVAQRVSE